MVSIIFMDVAFGLKEQIIDLRWFTLIFYVKLCWLLTLISYCMGGLRARPSPPMLIYVDLRDLRWFTLIYIDLRWFTLIYIYSCWFTLIYVVLRWFMLIYVDLRWFTLFYVDLHEFTLIYGNLRWFMLTVCLTLNRL